MCEPKDVNFLVKNQNFEVEITKRFALDHKSLYHNNETNKTITHL